MGGVLTGVTFDMSPVQRAPISHKCPGDALLRTLGLVGRDPACGGASAAPRVKPIETDLAGCEFFELALAEGISATDSYPMARSLPVSDRSACSFPSPAGSQ